MLVKMTSIYPLSHGITISSSLFPPARDTFPETPLHNRGGAA
jgi:hypothetical protein